MKHIVAILSLVFLAACTSGTTPSTGNVAKDIACNVEKAATSLIAAQIAMSLVCINLTAIQTDLQAVLGKVNLCPTTALKGPIGDALCGPIVTGIKNIGVGKIPPAWGCAGGATLDQLVTSATDACKKAISL
jgi:hypothetical protein